MLAHKARHRTVDTGLIAAAAQSAQLDMTSFGSILLYAKAAGLTDLVIEASPDGGTTWFTYQTVSSGGATTAVYALGVPMPGTMRLSIVGANGVNASGIEGVREVN